MTDLNPTITDEKPWWYYRCTHREHEAMIYSNGDLWGCFLVLREAEGVVALYVRCLDVIHFLVDKPGAGSVCQVLTPEQYEAMDEVQLMQYVQNKYRELKNL